MSVRVEHIGDATLYLGRCEDVDLAWRAQHDLLLTDPPYGIAAPTRHISKSRHIRPYWNGANEWAPIEGDSKPFDPARSSPDGYKDKDLTATPFAVAMALRDDGWWLRQVVIWDKTFAREPPRVDRPSVSHEYLFQLTKSADSATRDPGEPWFHSSVWGVRPGSRDEDHPAMMAAEIARRCVVRSSTRGDTVLDPFGGAGTTGLVADRLGRNAILIELNADYVRMAERRVTGDAPLFAEVSA